MGCNGLTLSPSVPNIKQSALQEPITISYRLNGFEKKKKNIDFPSIGISRILSRQDDMLTTCEFQLSAVLDAQAGVADCRNKLLPTIGVSTVELLS